MVEDVLPGLPGVIGESGVLGTGECGLIGTLCPLGLFVVALMACSTIGVPSVESTVSLKGKPGVRRVPAFR